MRKLLFWLMALVALPVAALTAETKAEAQAALDRGFAWLRGAQQADGSWSDRRFPGMSALALWAMANADSDANKDAIAKAEAYIVSCAQPDANIAKTAQWAHAEGLRAVAWLWALNRPDDPVALAHPDWHAVSLEGKSTLRPEDRPFVAYYQFLCPTHPEVRAYLADKARALAALPCVDAVQLDYIRLPDVVLPKALWPTYGLDMSTLLPPYDFCYCPRCKAAFGKEPDPNDPAWADFRLTQVAAVRIGGAPEGVRQKADILYLVGRPF